MTRTHSTKNRFPKRLSPFLKNLLLREDLLPGEGSDISEPADLSHQIINRLGDEIMVIRRDGRIIFVNDATIKGLGHSREFILSKPILYFHKDKITLKEWQKIYFDALKKLKKPTTFLVNRIAKGTEETIEITAVYMKYQQHEYLLSVARNVTERKRLENKLKESEELFRHFNDQAADAIFTVDLEGHIVYVNQAGANLLGGKIEQILGTHFEKYVSRTSLNKAWDSFKGVRDRGDSNINQDLVIVDRQGNLKPIEFSNSPIYKDGKLFQVHSIVRDVSKRKAMEELIRDSEKMKALELFIAGTTQEIQYPLKGLANLSQSLIEKYKGRDFEYIGYKEFKNIMESMEVIENQIKACCQITDRLLKIGRKKIGLKESSCDVNQTIQESLRLLKPQFDLARIKVNEKLDKKLPLADIGTIELSHVLNNILINAIQSMPGGGGMYIKSQALNKEKKILVECRDEGVGISKENLSRIFEPFFTTKQSGAEKQIGLGLSIVYSIIKSAHGEIDITSNLRHGTTVRISLPQSSSLK